MAAVFLCVVICLFTCCSAYDCTNNTYGDGCQTNCGHCFNMTQCHHINGTCFDGCDPGYEGQKCDQECQNRTYGHRCQRKCGHCLNSSQCDHVDGTCLQGCEEGYGGRTCNLVNLALRKPAYEENIYSHANINASNAVDGRKSNLHGTGGECSISKNNERTATWWVNLESIYSIHNIRIYYRTENLAWGPSNGHTTRFLGFAIYVSNTTDKLEGKLCYKDRNFTRSTIPAVFNTTCFVHGQYVIFYNERLQGCPTLGYYGINCTTPCPDANCGYCHIETGTCQGGCKPGYKGHQCELECDNRKYGDACQKSCGQCVNKTQCDNVIGTCLQGCEAGYKGQMCDQECTDGFFGRICQEKCNETCLRCNMFNGVCDKGCRPGWEGNYCQSACQDGKYGFECKEKCSPFCFRSGICHPKTGACLDGCKKGWTGDECFEVSVQDDGNTSTNLSVIGIAALSVAILSIMINAVQLLYKLLLRRQKNKRNRNKTCEQSKSEHVFTPDISGYDSLVISRPEDNYQELNTVTADR